MKKILNRKSHGSISTGILLSWFLFILLLLISFIIEIFFANLKANMVRDDIVLSNLAVYKDIDFNSLGDNPSVFKLSNPYKALDTFKTYLKKNMRLDDNMVGKNNSAALGVVKVKRYIIYNISGKSAEIYTYDAATNTFSKNSIDDIVKDPIVTPYGTVITKTSIHTTLEFDIKTLLRVLGNNKKTINVMADTDITY